MDSDDFDNGGHFHSGHGIGIAVLLGLVAFAFGARTARTMAQTVLLAGLAFVLYIGWRITQGTI